MSDSLGELIWTTVYNDMYEDDLSYIGANNLAAKILTSDWLAEIISDAEQRGKAEGWDEGWGEGLGVVQDDIVVLDWHENPYRADQIEENK